MGSAFARPIAVAAAALHLLAAIHGADPCAAAARQLVGRLPVLAATTSALAMAPAAAAAAHQRRAAVGGDGDAAAREGKWLPFLGAHHLPAAYWAHKPAPWAGVAGVGASPELGAGAVEGGEMEEEEGEAVRERGRERRRRHRDRDSSSSSSYVGDGESTRQEQLAMWASLLNPNGRGRPAAAGWLPAPGIGEAAAADEPPGTKASADTAVEGAEVEEPSAGQTYWGNNGN